MTTIIGFGNSLRGEDSFGLECLKLLRKEIEDKEINLLTKHQLLPELCIDLLDSKKIIFIDASYDLSSDYVLGCKLEEESYNTLSHYMTPKTIVYILKSLYYKEFSYEIYSMFTNNFEEIKSKKEFESCVRRVVSFIKDTN